MTLLDACVPSEVRGVASTHHQSRCQSPQQIVPSNSSTSDSDVMCCVSGVESGLFTRTCACTAKSSPSAYSLAAHVVEAVLCVGHKCRFTHSCLFAKFGLFLFVCCCCLFVVAARYTNQYRVRVGQDEWWYDVKAVQLVGATVDTASDSTGGSAYIYLHLAGFSFLSHHLASLAFSLLFFFFFSSRFAQPYLCGQWSSATDVCACGCFFRAHMWLKSRRSFRGPGPTSAVRSLANPLAHSLSLSFTHFCLLFSPWCRPEEDPDARTQVVGRWL